MATWDIARGPLKCQRCSATIGAGEPYRLVARVYKHCESCSIAADGQQAPAAMPVLSVREPLRFPDTFARYTPPLQFEREPGEDD